MAELPDPLTPPECDLQDFPFMPLHVARLRDSDLAATEHPEACWYAVLLWAASWHQLPAASLPDDDLVLTRLCGLGRDVKTFRKHRDGALRGLVKCSDGRLYHTVVAEQANASWAEKLSYRDRREKRIDSAKKAAAARWGEQSEGDSERNANGMRDASDAHAERIAAAMPKGTGTGTGKLEEEGSVAKATAQDDPEKRFWNTGKAYLEAAGVKNPGGVIGRWLKDHDRDDVKDALSRAQVEQAVDPVAFIAGVLRRKTRTSLDDGKPFVPVGMPC